MLVESKISTLWDWRLQDSDSSLSRLLALALSSYFSQPFSDLKIPELISLSFTNMSDAPVFRILKQVRKVLTSLWPFSRLLLDLPYRVLLEKTVFQSMRKGSLFPDFASLSNTEVWEKHVEMFTEIKLTEWLFSSKGKVPYKFFSRMVLVLTFPDA